MARRFLREQVAIVTGASSGIGRATAQALAAAGARVALAARSTAALSELAAEITGRGGTALAVPTDVTIRRQVEALVAATVSEWKRLDIVVANAGRYIQVPVPDATVEDFEEAMAINFFGAVYVVLAALPHMMEHRQGHVIVMSSLDGKKGIPPDAPYAAAKFALAGLGDVARQELAPLGVRVTTVFPGRVDTPLIDHLRVPRVQPKMPPERVAAAVLRALRRAPAEVVLPPFRGRAIAWLAAANPSLADRVVRRLRLRGWVVAPPTKGG